MNQLLECDNLCKNYKQFPALQGLNLSLEPGQIVGLLGPNGSGKTTLIKLINGLLTPTSGSVKVCGMEPGPDTKALISYLPERTYLNPNMKVMDTLNYFQTFYADFDITRARMMLESLSIKPDARLNSLSKGTKEKVQLILVMSRRAKIYILDEPIAGVDPAARDFIINTIINNYDEQALVLLSTHLISDVESILDRVLFIRDGRITLNMTTDQIRIDEGKSIDTLFREVFRC